MKANELRIGNWIMLDNDDVWNEKYNLTYQKIAIDDLKEMKSSVSVFSPIPLTTEILEKAGFLKNGFNNYTLKLPNTLQKTESYLVFSGDYLYLRHYNGENRMDDSVVTIWNKDLMKEFYLHSLQNVYFSLTSEELEFKQPITPQTGQINAV